MKLPRSVGADELMKRLRRLGYEPTRQSGSHIRLTTRERGEHHLTVPAHNPLKIGTLSAILNAVADHRGKSKEEITRLLFSD